MSKKVIQKLIDFETPSEEAICLHEAGHACAALLNGIAPAFLEFTNDPSSAGLARNRITVTDHERRKSIACGAYAVELKLFKLKRLADKTGTLIDEETFIQLAIGQNAAEDKQNFFGQNLEQDGFWPADYDQAFMLSGAQLAEVLSLDCAIALAEALLNERRLECQRIVEIAKPYLDTKVTSHLKCPKPTI